MPSITDIVSRGWQVRKVPTGDIVSERKATPIQAAYIGVNSSQVEVLRGGSKDNEIGIDKFNAGVVALNLDRAYDCGNSLGKWPTRQSGPFLLVTYRCRSFGRTALSDFYFLCRELGSAGPVSGRRLAADRVSDPAIDCAGRVGFGSSCCFLSWEHHDNGSECGPVPIKQKRRTPLCNFQPDIFFGFALSLIVRHVIAYA